MKEEVYTSVKSVFAGMGQVVHSYRLSHCAVALNNPASARVHTHTPYLTCNPSLSLASQCGESRRGD